MRKKTKILVVGSFVMDLVASADRAPELGETVIGTSFKTVPGGKGANQAVQAARLGASVTMVGCVGNDSFGDSLLLALNDSGVNTSHVKISNDHPTGVGHIEVQTAASGVQNRIIVVAGANYDLHPSDLDWLKDDIKEYDLVILQLELKMETTEYVARVAHDAGVPVMLNPAPAAPLSEALLSCVTFLTPNETEASALAGVPTDAEGRLTEDALKAAATVLKSKGVENVIITLGSMGAAICTEDGVVIVPCVRMDSVCDPTAAGDSFVGAFCSGYAAGFTIKEAMSLAVYTAAITVCGEGAIPSLPMLDKVLALMKERGADADLIKKLDILK